MQVTLVAKKVTQTRVTIHTEKIDVAYEEEKAQWTLPQSIFKPRAIRGPEQCDAKDYFDTPKVIEQMFEKDWERLITKVLLAGYNANCCEYRVADVSIR